MCISQTRKDMTRLIEYSETSCAKPWRMKQNIIR